MTRLAVFGATGGTGGRVVELAARRSIELSVLVRDTARLPASMAAHVVVGDARDQTAIVTVLERADAVVSCLGMHDITQPATDLSDATRAIAEAMQRSGPRRLLAIAAGGVLAHPSGGYRSQHGLPAHLQYVASEHIRIFEMLGASPLDWTLLCPLRLVDDTAHGQARWLIEELPSGSQVSGRWDLAAAALDLLGDASTLRKRIGIVSDRGTHRSTRDRVPGAQA